MPDVQKSTPITERPLYQAMMEAGTLDARHELALMRYAACRKAAEKAGWRYGPSDATFLTAQYSFFSGTFMCHVKELAELLTQPADPAWTYQDYLDSLVPFALHIGFDLDHILDEVGEFLAVDHPAQYREARRREAEMYQRWREHPEEQPAFFRRTRART